MSSIESIVRKLRVTVGVGPRGKETREISFSEEEVSHLRLGKKLNDEVTDLKDPRWVTWRREFAKLVGIDSHRYKCVVSAFRYVFDINLPEPEQKQEDTAPLAVVAAVAAGLIPPQPAEGCGEAAQA